MTVSVLRIYNLAQHEYFNAEPKRMHLLNNSHFIQTNDQLYLFFVEYILHFKEMHGDAIYSHLIHSQRNTIAMGV